MFQSNDPKNLRHVIELIQKSYGNENWSDIIADDLNRIAHTIEQQIKNHCPKCGRYCTCDKRSELIEQACEAEEVCSMDELEQHEPVTWTMEERHKALDNIRRGG